MLALTPAILFCYRNGKSLSLQDAEYSFTSKEGFGSQYSSKLATRVLSTSLDGEYGVVQDRQGNCPCKELGDEAGDTLKEEFFLRK
jgi:hypothetical protein